MNEYNIHLDDKAVDELKGAIGGGSGEIEYVELNSASGTIEVEIFQKLDFGGAYIKYNDIVLIPNGREQSGGGLGGTKTCYFDSTVNNNKYLSCVLTASLPLPPNATVPYTITEVSVGGGIEYISVSTSGGNVTVEQLRKVFDTGNWLPLNAFFVCNGQILVFVGTTSDETELVFTSNIQYGGTYYEMVLSSKRLDYTITTKTISNIS